MTDYSCIISNSKPVRVSFYKKWVEVFLRHNPVLIGHVLAVLVKDKRVSLPDYVKIETTNACNGKCVYCPRDKMTRQVGVMDPALYLRIIEELAQWGVFSVHLQNYGEPLLDPQIIDKVRFAKTKGIRHVNLFTNGMLLTDSIIEGLIEAGLDELNISIDVCEENTHDALRKNLSYANIVNNLKNLINLRKDKKLLKPKITLASIIHSEKKDGVGEFINRWGSLVEEIHFQKPHDWAACDTQKIPHNFPCVRLWTSLTMLWDGRVSICCVDYDGKNILGDVRKQGIRQIWNSDEYAAMRALHLRPELPQIELCSNCTLRLKDSPLWVKKILF